MNEASAGAQPTPARALPYLARGYRKVLFSHGPTRAIVLAVGLRIVFPWIIAVVMLINVFRDVSSLRGPSAGWVVAWMSSFIIFALIVQLYRIRGLGRLRIDERGVCLGRRRFVPWGRIQELVVLDLDSLGPAASEERVLEVGLRLRDGSALPPWMRRIAYNQDGQLGIPPGLRHPVWSGSLDWAALEAAARAFGPADVQLTASGPRFSPRPGVDW